MKTCSACEETKPLDAFHKDRSREDGVSNRCKECERARQRERYRKARGDLKAAGLSRLPEDAKVDSFTGSDGTTVFVIEEDFLGGLDDDAEDFLDGL